MATSAHTGALLCRGQPSQATEAYIECVCLAEGGNRPQTEGGRFAPGRFRVVTLSPRLGFAAELPICSSIQRQETLVPIPSRP